MGRFPVKTWAMPGALLLLGSLPILTGGLQLAAIAEGLRTGTAPSTDSANYVANPLPIVAHILGGSLFTLLAVGQVWPALRQRFPKWHRAAGRVTISAGLAAGISALWMNQFVPDFGGLAKYSASLFFGLGLCATLILALRAIRRGDVTSHRIWILRAIAIGFGPATQMLLFLPWFIAFGLPGDPWLGFLRWLGWAINLAFGEWRIARLRRGAPPVPRRLPPAQSAA